MANDEPKINQLGELLKEIKAADENLQVQLIQNLIAMNNLCWSIGLATLELHLKCSQARTIWREYYFAKWLPPTPKKK